MEKQNARPKISERKPIIELDTRLSQDGRYWVIKRIETWILPANYLAAITKNHSAKAIESDSNENSSKGGSDANSNG